MSRPNPTICQMVKPTILFIFFLSFFVVVSNTLRLTWKEMVRNDLLHEWPVWKFQSSWLCVRVRFRMLSSVNHPGNDHVLFNYRSSRIKILSVGIEEQMVTTTKYLSRYSKAAVSTSSGHFLSSSLIHAASPFTSCFLEAKNDVTISRALTRWRAGKEIRLNEIKGGREEGEDR